MKSPYKILAIDIGAGTQDILLYNTEFLPENCISLILPTPSRLFAEAVDKSSQDLFIEGDPIGGGAIPSRLKRHLEKGYRVIMSEEAAYTVRNNLEEVKQYGIEIHRGKIEGFKGTIMKFHEIDLILLKDFFAHFGEEFNLDLVAIAVQDHGISPEGTSNREFRFKMIEKQLKKNNRLESFVYSYNEIPVSFKRMQAVTRTAMTQIGCKVLVMDTSFAAILGCLEESSSSVFVNVGNNHTLVAMVSQGRIEGVMEHHTRSLNLEKLENLLLKFMDKEISSREIWEDGGHGAVILGTSHWKIKEIVVTGPNREMLRNSHFNVRFAAPHGNMMLTGPFGLVKGAYLKYGIS